MKKRNLISIDLAKNVFEVMVEDRNRDKITMSKRMSRAQLARFLAKQAPATVAMEACSGAHYWSWVAESHGHEVILLPVHHVAPYRQGHKTDRNDTAAVSEAAKRPNRKEAVKKTPEQLEYQMFLRVRANYSHEKRRMAQSIRGQLAEFGIVIPKSYSALQRQLPEILEDADNGLPWRLRSLLQRQYQSYLETTEQLAELEREIVQLAKEDENCRKIQALEGIGPVNAIALYTRIGNGQAFHNGRQASACIGVTPQQHSSGGIANIGHIRKKHVDKEFRATLLQGARSVVYQLRKKPPTTALQRWLVDLIARRGERVAIVALANKNVRIAWAILRTGEEYQAA